MRTHPKELDNSLHALVSGVAGPVLELSQVSRSFGPVQVLFDIDFDIRPGEVHALIGENGAGKSTMMKIMSGYLEPTRGGIVVNGQPTAFASSEDAEHAGIVLIHQEFNLALQLTVQQNIFLGRELCKGWFLDHESMRRDTLELLTQLETEIAPNAPVSKISVADKQMVEIAKALSGRANVLIMDEPTAALTGRETVILFRQIERLKAAGAAIVYTSHKLDEVMHIADRVTVLRDGRHVLTSSVEEMTEDAMAEAMVGRELSNLYPAKRAAGEIREQALSVENFSVGDVVRDISFELRRGEILGFAGLVGSGRTEVFEGLIGVVPATGTVKVNGKPCVLDSVESAKRAGIVYLTEDRKERGLLLNQGMRQNLTLLALADFANILIDGSAEEAALNKAISDFDIRAPSGSVQVGNLSGGNQQKLLLAKTMLCDPQIVIIDEPTRGIDIGTKQQIYEFIHGLASAGRSVIVISSEMNEIIGLAERVIVMRGGQIAGEISSDEISEEVIVRLAMGLTRKAEDNGNRNDS